MTNSAPILVVGGGIGGLTAALGIGRKGWPVKVLEETPEFGAIGYGIQLGPNVFHMFERLGISQAVLEKSIVPKAVTMLDSIDGEAIVRIPTGAASHNNSNTPMLSCIELIFIGCCWRHARRSRQLSFCRQQK